MNSNEIKNPNDVIDVALFNKEGKAIPKGLRYKIIVDRTDIIVDKECLTGAEILVLAGKSDYMRFQLNQRLKGGKVNKIDYEQIVCFTQPGVEKFMTIPLDQTEG